MNRQPSLFDQAESGAIMPRDPRVIAVEAVRLSRQSREILDRLERGPATNKELAGIALKYTSRTSDLRLAGYDVRVIERDHKTGLAVYALFREGEQVATKHRPV